MPASWTGAVCGGEALIGFKCASVVVVFLMVAWQAGACTFKAAVSQLKVYDELQFDSLVISLYHSMLAVGGQTSDSNLLPPVFVVHTEVILEDICCISLIQI